MAADGKNRWIVLLNKSPKGPFVAEEIRALLEQQVIRRNDIAYQLPSDADSKSPTEWKLLWQFPEFDRRRDLPQAPPAKPSIVEVIAEERRQQKPPALTAEIPSELLNIAPEDLIPKTTTITALSAPLDRGETADTVSAERPDLDSMRAAFSAKWIFGSFGTVLLAVVGWMLYSSGGRGIPVAAPRAISAPPPSENRPAERRAVMTRPSLPPAPAAPPLRRTPAEAPRRYQEPEVSEPDSGEIEENDGDAAEGDMPMDPRRMADPRFRNPGMPPGMDPMDPRMMDPRMMDPRMMDPRMMDPRFRGGRRGRMPTEAAPPEDGGTGEDGAVPADGGPEGDDAPSDD